MSERHTHGGTDAPECTTCRPLDAASAQDTADPADGLSVEWAVDAGERPNWQDRVWLDVESRERAEELVGKRDKVKWRLVTEWVDLADREPPDPANKLLGGALSEAWRRGYAAGLARQRPTAPPEDRVTAAVAWDEAVQAVAWAMDNGFHIDGALRYAREHNPFRFVRDTAEPEGAPDATGVTAAVEALQGIETQLRHLTVRDIGGIDPITAAIHVVRAAIAAAREDNGEAGAS